MKPSVIAAIGHVAIQVEDLEAAIELSTSIMGLRVSRQDADSADLTHGRAHHSLQYYRAAESAFDHVGLEAADDEALEQGRERLRAAGATFLSDSPLDPDLRAGFVFELPGGMPIEVYTGMPKSEPEYLPAGVRPRRFGHVNLYVEDPMPAIALLTEALDFRVSDWVRGGAFVRCNADHHGLAVLPGDTKMQHQAWEVESLADLGRLGDLLHSAGSHLIEGPIRHGVGSNLAAYFIGAGGEAIEYYTDMDQILNDDDHVPGRFEASDTTGYSKWVPRLAPDGLKAAGVPSIRRSGRLPAALAAKA